MKWLDIMTAEKDQNLSDASLGRIFGKNVTELHYRSFYDQDIYVGEILVAEDSERERNFLLRVVDIEYGTETADRNWDSRTAGNMMLMDKRGEGYDLHDAERRLYRTAICTPLGYYNLSDPNLTFKSPKTIPNHFSLVRKTTDNDLKLLDRFLGDIHAGYLRSGEDILTVGAGMFGTDFPQHIGVFATTGMGKSNLMKTLAASVLGSGKYGMLILDPHGEYYDGGADVERQGLVSIPGAGKNLIVFSTRQLSGPYNRIKLSAHEIEVDDLMALYDFSGPQKDAFNTAIRVYRDDWLLELLERDIDELVIDMPGTFEGSLGVIKRRLKNLFHYGLITKDKSISITSSIYRSLQEGKVVLVDTSGMGESEELLVSTVLARYVLDQNKSIYAKPDEFNQLPPMLITLEEAQRVLGLMSQTGRYNVFAKIAREGRKFKTGLCAISQQPKLIDPEILSQFNTLFILGLADRRDREILRSSARQDISRLDNEIQMLMPGEAVITSPRAPFALPVMIHLFEDYLKLVNASHSANSVPGPGKGGSDPKPVMDDKFF
jgi:DNA helicase HerA-like ATPase